MGVCPIVRNNEQNEAGDQMKSRKISHRSYGFSLALQYKNPKDENRKLTELLAKKRESDDRLNPTFSHLFRHDSKNNETIKNEKWMEINPNLDVQKLLMIYPEYSEDREIFNGTWRKEVMSHAVEMQKDRLFYRCLCPQLKLSIRKYFQHLKGKIKEEAAQSVMGFRGVPLLTSREIFLKIFGVKEHLCEISYSSTLETVFKGKIPNEFRNCPTFSDQENIQNVILIDMLSTEGKLALQRLLWLFQKMYAGLKYCPLLPVITALLLSIFKESETFQIVSTMLDITENLLDNNREEGGLGFRCLRWYFPMNEDILRKVCKTFRDEMKHKSLRFGKAMKHLDSIGFDSSKLLLSWFSTMFQGFLNQDFIFRILFCFLNEGIKVFYRFSFAFIFNLRVFHSSRRVEKFHSVSLKLM